MKKKVKGCAVDRHILIKKPSKIGLDQAIGWEYSANSDSIVAQLSRQKSKIFIMN